MKKKGNGPVTFELLTEFYADFLKPQFEDLSVKMDKGFRSLRGDVKNNSEHIKELKSEIGFLKDDVKGIKSDLSDTPSRKEFNQLKTKIKTLHI